MVNTYADIKVDIEPQWKFLTFFRIHGTIALIINIIGLLLIFKNFRLVKMYKYFLINMQIISIFSDALLSLLMQPSLLFPIFAVYSNGPLYHIFGISTHIQLCFFMCFIYFQIAAIVSAIIAKHQIIASIGTIEIHPYLFRSFIVIYHSLAILIFILFYFSNLYRSEIEQLIALKFPSSFAVLSIPNLAMYDVGTNSFIIFVVVFMNLILILSIVISFYFSVDLFRNLREKRKLISTKNYTAHRIAITSLMAQAVLPLIVLIGPFIVLNYLFVVTVPGTQKLSNLMLAVYSTHSTLSTLIMIISTPHYRRFIMKGFRLSKSSIVPQVNNIQSQVITSNT